MTGKEFDFDHAPQRRGTGSYKWDSSDDPDVLPLWVADMDFTTAPAIIEALRSRVDHGVFGYVRVPDDYYSALTSWFQRRHSWLINRESVIYTSGVVPAISAIIKALTKQGDGVIVMTPVYNCFFSSIRNNGCRIIDNPLKRIDSPYGFTYAIDFDDLEKKASSNQAKLLLLCNPHNPAGRTWSRDELQQVNEICSRNGVRVVSDEIHCELTMPGITYVPYATVDPAAVICCSPSKAFNTAGLQIANIVTPEADIRAKIDRAINDNEVCDVNPFGVVGLIAAYNHGERWLDALRDYLYGNYMVLREFFTTRLPSLPVAALEATYLAWIDISSLGLSSETFEQLALKEGKVWVNAGTMYGIDGFIRINMACPRQRLLDGLERLRKVIDSHI